MLLNNKITQRDSSVTQSLVEWTKCECLSSGKCQVFAGVISIFNFSFMPSWCSCSTARLRVRFAVGGMKYRLTCRERCGVEFRNASRICRKMENGNENGKRSVLTLESQVPSAYSDIVPQRRYIYTKIIKKLK